MSVAVVVKHSSSFNLLRFFPRRSSSMAAKLGLLLASLLLCACAVALMMLAYLQQVYTHSSAQVERSERHMLAAVRWQALSDQATEAALAGVQSSEEALLAQAHNKSSALWAAADAVLAEMPAGDVVLPEMVLVGAQAVRALFAQAFRARDLGQAWEVQALLSQKLLPALKVQSELVAQSLIQQEQARHRTHADAMARQSGAKFVALGAYAVLLVVGVLLSWWLVRRLTAPLLQAIGVAQTIAQGDLRVQVQVQRSDEAGALMRNLMGMAQQLQALIGQVHEGVQAVNHACGDIALGNGDLVARTAQATQHLQQCMQQMQHITEALVQTAQLAQQADALAVKAVGTAQQGRDTVNVLAQSMQHIARCSSEIAAITGVIDGIASQTNILALNAAVEAARAGTQGRGFAVVASEVRALALRSADAAKQIKGLISTTHSQVDAGVAHAQHAAQNMQAMERDVVEVGQLIAQMAHTTASQRDGLAHVHMAVKELHTMTAQNAVLVQGCNQATASLQQDVQTLLQGVQQFRLPSAASTHTTRPAMTSLAIGA